MSDNNGWLPIATAPRDGTPVDLWHKSGSRFIDEWWTDDLCWTCLLDDSEFIYWRPILDPLK